jgi:hypothetical protein
MLFNHLYPLLNRRGLSEAWIAIPPTEGGTHLPTPGGLRTELAQEGRLHQTFDYPAKM